MRSQVHQLGLRPAKSLGQSFVTDPNTVRRIVRLADLQPDDVVLEVGPGLGSLTLGLLAAAARVVTVEIDRRLADALPRTVRERRPDLADRLEVVAADALRVPALPGPPPTALVANLPYNVAVPVLLRSLERFTTIRRGVVMVQAEVADRLTAPPGGREYGVPSAKAAWYAEVRAAGRVPASVFWPVPRVESALVAFRRREPPRTTASRSEVFALVEAAFAHRRKTLRGALSGWAGSPSAAEAVLLAAGVDPRARGETLHVADFARIAERGPRPPAR